MIARLESALTESIGRRNDLVIRYRADVQKELQDTRERSGKLLEGQAGLEDRVRKAALYAPVDGLVKTVKMQTEAVLFNRAARWWRLYRQKTRLF